MPRRQKRKSNPKRRAREPTPEWYEIKQILDERVEKGKPEYLIDWAGTDEKGNPWPPSWQQEVTPDEIEKWEAKKKQRTLPQALPQPEPTNKRPISEVESDSDDDEPLIAKRRRTLPRLEIPSEEPTDDDEPLIAKRRRNLPRLEISSEEPALSQPSPSSTFETEVGTPVPLTSQDLLRPNQQLLVTLKEPTIDRSEYLSVSTTQGSSQRVSELEEEDDRLVFTSQNSQGTIPDSQGLSGDVWSQSQILNSAVGGAEKQSIRGDGNSVVIPDSQDLSLNFSVSEHSVGQEQDLLPSNRITPDHSQQEVVPDSIRAEADIPSHQPEPTSDLPLSSIEHRELPTTGVVSQEPSKQPLSSSDPGTHHPPSPEPSPAPVFLSQIPISFDTSLGISEPSLIIESSRSHTFVNIQGQASQEDPDVSQHQADSASTEQHAAQVVPRNDLETVHDTFEDSHEPCSEAQNFNTSPSSHREGTAEESSEQRLTYQPDISPPANPQSSRATGVTMEGGSRPSAADEIRRLLGDIDTDLEDSMEGSPFVPVSGRVPFMSRHDEVETIDPTATVRSPQLHDESSLLARSDHWNPDAILTEPFVAPQSISPASLMNPAPSAHDEIMNLVQSTFDDDHMPSIASTLMPDIPPLHPTTIAPADIINTMNLAGNDTPSSQLDHSSGQSITMGQIPGEDNLDEGSSPIQPEPSIDRHLVTLPFQASRRPVYDEIVSKYRPDAETFGHFFSDGTSDEHSEALVKRIDEFFLELTNVCDYPQHLVGTTLEELPASKQAKYIRDANPKFNFVFEFLKDIDKDTEILIVAGTPELLRLLFTLTEDLELECTSESIGKLDSAHKDSAARVKLVLDTEEHDPYSYNVVIGFDILFGDSLVAKALSRGGGEDSPLLLLQLATIHSIEHIAQHIPPDLSRLERRNALLLGIAKARGLVQEPQKDKDHEPHRAAQVFSDYVNGKTDIVDWVPRSIPSNVIAIFVSSQIRSQLSHGISQGGAPKHRLDDDEANEEDPKRVRLSPAGEMTTEPNNPPIPEPVRSLLKSAELKVAPHKLREAIMRVPMATMSVITEQISELERKAEDKGVVLDIRQDLIGGLEKRIAEYERTTDKVANSNLTALEDRYKSEKEVQQAKDALRAAQDAHDLELAQARKRISDLEARVVVLTSPPEVGKLNQLLNEATEKVQRLERRLENANNDSNYARDEYQKATARAGALNSENKALRETNEELSKQASENLAKIHQVQKDTEVKEHLKTIEALRAQLAERDFELEQLRALKNGRPQTRQTSVPRSPRTITMSPRNGRFGSSASRGTSPAAPGQDGNGSGGVGMQFMGQQPGNSRWNHLRE